MDSSPHQNKTLGLHLTLLVSFFTILTTLIGATFFTATYIPLYQNQVHGKEAIILYKTVNILGLVLVPLALATGAVCIAVIKSKLTSHTPQLPLLPPRPSLVQRNAETKSMMTAMPMLQTKSQMEWDAIEEPDYEYLNELILAFVREKKRGKEQQLQRDGQEDPKMGKIIDV